jgi:hypothetical protein
MTAETGRPWCLDRKALRRGGGTDDHGSSTDNAEGEATPIADQGDSPTAQHRSTQMYSTVPAPTTAAPSEIPTSGPLFDPPSEEDCAAIANGDALTNQERAIQSHD